MSAARRAIGSPQIRSAIRFAVAVAITDAVVLAVLGQSDAALLGSFAVAIHLYFLDFDGDARERFAGHAIAMMVGFVAVTIGVLCASPVALAVLATFVVSSTFAYMRLLRGYVARSAVGLQGAFFLPLMVASDAGDLPGLLAGWAIGSGIAIVAALVVLPHRRTGAIRALLGEWLRSASSLAAAIDRGQSPERAVSELTERTDALVAGAAAAADQPGAVGRRQRALANMVLGARWSLPLAERLGPVAANDDSSLAATSSDAFGAAADIVTGGSHPSEIPDVPAARRRDLEDLASETPDVVRAHYSVRLLSIAAMNQLFNAACSRGWDAPEPDVGRLAAQRPLLVLRENLHLRSLWTHNALRTGLGAAASVAIVRAMGLSHGVWVVLAALVVTQVSLSGSSGVTTMGRVVTGSTCGVLLAGAISLLHLPHLALVVLLPVAAFVAKWRAGPSLLIAQLVYAPFALVNFTVLSWPPHQGLEVVRAENILIGAAVAAAFSLLVFPNGVLRLLARLRDDALESSRTYLEANIATIESSSVPSPDRSAVLRDLGAYETAVDAALLHHSPLDDELSEHEWASSVAHDRLIGGDACAEIAEMARREPRFATVGNEMAQWWDRFLDRLPSESRIGGDHG